jgi:RNA polymerase sigma factor (TIGR02999 family)
VSTFAYALNDEIGIAGVFDSSLYLQSMSLAAKLLRRERRNHGWEASDLVHEAFLRIASSPRVTPIHSRGHAFALMAVVMRHILADRARSPTIFTHSYQVSLDPDWPCRVVSSVEGLALDIALERLGSRCLRASQVVEMHGVLGMKLQDVASKLAVSTRTVKREWNSAREWLGSELGRSRCPKTKRRPARENQIGRIPRRTKAKAAGAVACLAETV